MTVPSDSRPGPAQPVRLPVVVPIAVAIVWLVSTLAILFDSGPLRLVAGVMAAILGIGCLVRKGGMVRAFALVLGAASAALLLVDAKPGAALEGLERAGMFCAFLAGLYALRSSVETSPALGGVRARLRNLPQEIRRGVMLWLGWSFSVPLAIGALSVVAPLVPPDADVDERAEAATWGIRGMALTVLFSPFTMAMGVVTTMGPRVPLLTVMMIGLPLSLAAMMVPLVLRSYRSPLSAGWSIWIDVGKVLAPVLILIALDLTVSGLLGWSAVEASVVLVTPFAAAMVLAGGSPARLHTAVAATRVGWGRFDTEVAIFTSALVFAALATSSATVMSLFDHAAHLAGPEMLVVLGMAAVCLLSMIGVHMVVPAVIVLSVFGPLMPDTMMAVLLCVGVLIGWSFGAMTALGSISFLVATTIFRVPARTVAFGSNLGFMIGLVLVYGAGVLILA